MFLIRNALVAAGLAQAAGSQVWPPAPGSKTISWWYQCDGNWPLLIENIKPYLGNSSSPSLVTTIQTYCGFEVVDGGVGEGSSSWQKNCHDFFQQANELGVKTELVLNAGNCDIENYRKLWADTTESPQKLLELALAYKVSGWNFDLEPQTNNCAGGPGPTPGVPEDAKRYAAWLKVVRSVLAPHGIRVTVAVSSGGPVLGQFAELAASSDRLQNMASYNGDSMDSWERTFYGPYLNATPIDAVGVGIGSWQDGKGSWWETPEGASAKVAKAKSDGVPELAIFRFIYSPTTSQPASFWWKALAEYF